MSRKLNIGSGDKWELYREKGFESIDIVDFGQEYVANVLDEKEGLARFKDNDFDEVMAQHFIEHLSQDEVKYVFNQVHRILKKDGVFKVCVPHIDHPNAYVIGHKTFWTEESFKWFEQDDMETTYKIKPWKIEFLNTNERPDIHCYLKPVK